MIVWWEKNKRKRNISRCQNIEPEINAFSENFDLFYLYVPIDSFQLSLIYIYIVIHTHTHIYIYIYIYICVCVCVCVWEREREREFMLYICVCVCERERVYVRVYICMCVCACLVWFICLMAYKHHMGYIKPKFYSFRNICNHNNIF